MHSSAFEAAFFQEDENRLVGTPIFVRRLLLQSLYLFNTTRVNLQANDGESRRYDGCWRIAPPPWRYIACGD